MKKLKIALLFACANAIAASLYSQELDWAISMGEANYDEGHSIAVDASGNVYTTGLFLGTADFDPGPGTFNLTSNNSGADVFVSKLDASGNLVWAKQIGGISHESGKELVVDAAGNVYITGILSGTADFDPGIGTYNLTSSGGYDIFVCKLDVSGNFVWAGLMGGATNDEGFSIAVDATGNVYTTGYFTGTADFDPGAGTHNRNSWGMHDIFISKLDASGNFVWAKSMGGSDYDQGHGIAVDGSGNVCATGGFQVGVDFDPGPGACVFNALGSEDIFICKFDASGNFVWAKQIGGTQNYDYGFSVCTDNSDNVYTCGYFGGTVDFDPGSGVTNLVSAGSVDAFACKLDASGNFVWAKDVAPGNTDNAYDIAVDGSGNVYTTGYFGGTADFDPGPGTFSLTTFGGPDDIFISKLDASGNFTWARQMGGTGYDEGFSIAVDNAGSVHVIGNFMGTADFDPSNAILNLVSAGTYDIFVVKLNDCVSANYTEAITGCAPYTWRDGNTYTTTQTGVTYIADGAVTGGCDSVYVLNLTIINASTGTDVITECDSYTWIDGVTYTSSNNTATYILTNAAGCDSIVTLNLTINNTPTMTATDNGSGTLTASSASSYQWIDCSTNAAVPGATNASFTPLANGTYAAVGYSGLCSDTSNCLVINYLNIDETNSITWNILPNPASDQVTILFNVSSAELIIRDVHGKPIEAEFIHSGEIISMEKYSPGVYFFELITAEGKTVKRVLKM